jgi:hypothetical protein
MKIMQELGMPIKDVLTAATINASLALLDDKNFGMVPGRNTSMGWGSKDSTIGTPLRRRAFSTTASIKARWPKCCPSKLPIVRTGKEARGAGGKPLVIFISHFY